MKRFIGRRAIGLATVIASVVAAAPAYAAQAQPSFSASPVDTSWCTNPLMVQPFAGYRDDGWYTLVPGQIADGFNGAGWTLTGGAKVVTTTLADGTTGSVLNLPSGSQATSPTICVQSNYPTARTMVRDVIGAEGVQMYVSYEGTKTWQNPKNVGQVHGQGTSWSLSDQINLQPYNIGGWQPMRFTLLPGGKTSDFQIYDFYVDPRIVG